MTHSPRYYRTRAKLTQASLAKQLGIKQPYYSAIENGKKPFPFHVFWGFVQVTYLTPQEMYDVAKLLHK